MSIQADLTLEAALRDVKSTNHDARFRAVRNLAPALLEESGQLSPSWRAWEQHRLGEKAVQTLWNMLDEESDPVHAGMALHALGSLGDARVLEIAPRWLDLEGDDEDKRYLREMAIKATTYVGAAAKEENSIASRVIKQQVADLLFGLLEHGRADIRASAAEELPQVDEKRTEGALLQRLTVEKEASVRDAVVFGLSLCSPPSEALLTAMEGLVESAEGKNEIGFEAARILADGRRASAVRRLTVAITERFHRDLAMEALAVLDPADTMQAVAPLTTLVSGLFTPAMTRVRAAYALATIKPDAGRKWLARLAWHPSANIRAGVREARNMLDERQTSSL